MDVHDSRARRHGLFALTLILLTGGGVAIFMGTHNFFIRAIGSLACVAAAYLIKKANVRSGLGAPASAAKAVPPRESKRPPRVMLAAGIVLLVAVGFSFHYLYRDALGGYHEVAPVYVFASVGIACTAVWAYVISKILG